MWGVNKIEKLVYHVTVSYPLAEKSQCIDRSDPFISKDTEACFCAAKMPNLVMWNNLKPSLLDNA